MGKILVTGALGQIGSELVDALRQRYGVDHVVASDIRLLPAKYSGEKEAEGGKEGPFEYVDCIDQSQVAEAVRRHEVEVIYHLAALLSATAEERPHVAWNVNMGGLYSVLEVARQNGCKIFMPSSIGAFGPGTPKKDTPQDTVQRPTTMYGVTKVAGELLCDYYYQRFRVDARGVRFPGLISYVAPPGGGTTDYAVEIFYAAVRHERYTCFLSADTRLDMMYMPDALEAIIGLMEADSNRLQHRNAFNVTAMNFTPRELAAEIRQHLPEFRMQYDIDPTRQDIADSWPDSLDDSAAREEWGWNPKYDMASMTRDMLEKLATKVQGEEEES